MSAHRIDRLLVVAALLATLLSGGVPYAEAATDRPQIVSPEEGALVSGKLTVEARSTAKYVNFRMKPWSLRSKVVEVVDGQASATFSTLGLDGSTEIEAHNCTAPRDCDSRGDYVHVVVDNPGPTITAPADGSSHFPTSDLKVTVDLPAGAVALHVDHYRDRLRDKDPPFVFRLDGTRLAAGSQEIVATACDGASPLCRGKTDSVTVSVLSPGLELRGEGQPSISPNGDGVDDSAQTQFRLVEPSDVSVQVLQDGSLIRTVDLGTLGAGQHQVDLPEDLGPDPLPHGKYTVRIVARLAVEPSIVERIDVRMTVDLYAPLILAMEPAHRTFYPFNDGYRDWSRLAILLDEPASVDFEITDESGVVVLSEDATEYSWERNFTYGHIWEGRKFRRGMYPEGVYTVNWTMTDRLGNTDTAVQHIRLEHDELVERSVRIRVEAAEAVEWDIGRCSDVRRDRRWPEGRALLSDVSCDSSPYDNRKHIVAGYYRATLPKSLTPQRAALQVYGGAAQARSRLGSAVWLDGRDEWTDVHWAQRTTGWHPFFHAQERLTRDALRGRTLTWIHFVNGGMRYRIRDIELRTTRTFLVERADPAVRASRSWHRSEPHYPRGSRAGGSCSTNCRTSHPPYRV